MAPQWLPDLSPAQLPGSWDAGVIMGFRAQSVVARFAALDLAYPDDR
jgi:hypothetical protein